MKEWVRWGCLGTLAVFVLLAVLAGYLFVSARWNAEREQVEPADLTQVLSAPSPGSNPSPGKIVIDFTLGELIVQPGPPGSPIRIEGQYDTKSYELTQELKEADDGTWEYRIRFGQSGFFRDWGLRAAFGGTFPKVRMTLPPDVPFALESTSSKGPCTMELGGLWLTEVELSHQKGPLEVDFGEPTVHPLERLKIRGKQGPTEIDHVGNASPRVADIRGSMGPTEVDLRGAWAWDADVTIRGAMGPTEVRLPRSARVEGSGADRFPSPESTEFPLPTLRLSVQSWFGPTDYH